MGPDPAGHLLTWAICSSLLPSHDYCVRLRATKTLEGLQTAQGWPSGNHSGMEMYTIRRPDGRLSSDAFVIGYDPE